jgi:uncharacterized protein (DUF302 family)
MLTKIKYVVATSKAPAEALVALKAALAEQNFGVLWELDFNEKLKEKGVETDAVFHLLEVCNPKKAKEALEHEIEMGFFLPCKAVVFVRDGQTYMGIMKPSALLEGYAEPELLSLAMNVEDIMAKALDVAANA